MPSTYFVRPVFRVRDVAASITYYCEKLGCTRRWQHGDPQPIIAEVEREDLAVILDSTSVVPKPPGPSVITLSLHDPATLAELHRDLTARGARILNPPFPTVWQPNTHQLDVEDLDGNILVFWGEKPG